jgi:tetratricopeptide (TPR) repeat protein/HAMP domain-containing protein
MFDLLNQHNIYFNFLSFGSMLATSFAFFFFVFLLSIKQKSPYTVALAKTSFYQGFFYAGYFISAMIYHPAAADHRLMTVGFIYPALIYFLQFVFLFPENTWPKIQKSFLVVQWIIGLGLLVIFYYITRTAEYKFHFTGHYWDYDAEFISKIVAYFIMLYIFLTPIVGIIKIIHYRKEKKYRNALILYIITMMIGTIAPGILNTLSRDGVVERGIFLNVLVISVVTMLFILSVLYINVTEDRTTFMAKIIGITLVTFLLLMQGLAYITLGDKEKEYDALRVEYVEKAIKSNIYHPEMVYLYKFDLINHENYYIYTREDYFRSSEKDKIPFQFYLADLENTAFYVKIKNYDGENFKEYLEKELSNTPDDFIAYKMSILEFLKNYKNVQNKDLKKDLLQYLDQLNKLTFVHYNRITFIHNENFRSEIIKYLQKTPKEFKPFKEVILNLLKENQQIGGKELKLKIYNYLAPLRPDKVRHYRASKDGFTHYVSYVEYDQKNNVIYEGGYRYIDYRAFIHKSALQQTIIFLIIFFVITGIYPLFFRGSLIKPLDELLEGVKKVNHGDLTVKVPVYVQDEIGYLATSFNKMVVSIREAKEQLQDYANNLEEKVKERTAELNASLQEVRRLKQIQDGDYYLTSLLQKPLMVNFNKSKKVPTEFIIKQYKEFEFRGKVSEIGGDVCVTGNLRLGKSLETAKRYIVAMNGDAMGKSTQGAGGALVMGVVMNAIMARSARHDRVLDMTPEEWLREIYEEIHGVFSAFNGSMCISCVIDLIDEETGKMYYFNAEHPFQVLYRKGKASFIEEELKLRKLGLESEYPFEVHTFLLEPGDIVLAGSDGRDDIELEMGDGGVRIINENEYLFLEIVEEAKGDLQKIFEGIKKRGKITDDISLLKIEYLPVAKEEKVELSEPSKKEIKKQESTNDIQFVYTQDQDRKQIETEKVQVIVLDEEDPNSVIEEMDMYQQEDEFEEYFQQGNEALKNHDYHQALEFFTKAYEIEKNNQELNKKLAVLTFKLEDYEKAVEILEKYLEKDPYIEDFWLYLSISHKKRGNLEKALETVEKAYELNPKRIPILLQLADVHFLLKHIGRANIFLEKVFELDPDNEQANRLKNRIEHYILNSKTTK